MSMLQHGNNVLLVDDREFYLGVLKGGLILFDTTVRNTRESYVWRGITLQLRFIVFLVPFRRRGAAMAEKSILA